MPKRKPATLPPFEWKTSVEYKGKPRRLARPSIECSTMRDGSVKTGKRLVWRKRPSPLYILLNEAERHALDNYAIALEVVSGAKSEPQGGGGANIVSAGPSHRALIEAEKLRAMRRALRGIAISIPRRGIRGRALGPFIYTFQSLVHDIIFSNLNERAILLKMGLTENSASKQEHKKALQQAAHSAASRLMKLNNS